MRRFHLMGLFLGSIILAAPACGQDALIPSPERLAASGNAEAIYHLGMAYQTGTGVNADPAKALEAFRRGASLGDPLAAYKLGCFYDGQGAGLVEDDPVVALKHKLVAAEAGHALAQQDVAGLYARNGNAAEALRWLEKGAAQGWPGALMALASVHNDSPGFPPDAAKTAAYFRIFIDRTDGDREQRDWVAEFERGMTPEDRARADAIVRDYRPVPSTITLKALSGQRAAEVLVRRTGS